MSWSPMWTPSSRSIAAAGQNSCSRWPTSPGACASTASSRPTATASASARKLSRPNRSPPMAAAKSAAKKNSPALLRQFAIALPEVTEGVTCDKAAYKAGGKSFLFVGSDGTAATIMLKLQASLPEAKKLAAAHPATYKVGGTNWVTITLPHDQPPPMDVLERWIVESYRLLVPKALVAILDGEAGSSSQTKASGKSGNTKSSTKSRKKVRRG